MRKLLWVLGIPLFLVVLAALLLPMLLDEKALVELASERIEAQSGIVLQVNGEASLSLFPTASLFASDVSLSIPENNTQIEAGTLRAGVALLPLLRRTVQIDSIEVDSLTLTTEAIDEDAAKAAAIDTARLSDRELDVYYAARAKSRQLAQAEAAASVLAVPLALEVGELALRDIHVITVDSAGESISEILLKHLTVTDLNLDGRSVPLSAHLVIPDASGAAPIEVVIAGDFTTDLGTETLTLGSLAVSITGATPDTVKLAATGTVALNTQVTTLDLELEVGEMTGSGELRYASFESPQIDTTLALTTLNPALLVLAGPDATAATTPKAEDDANGDIPLPLHSIRMIDTRAQLKIERVIVDVHTLNDVSATLRVVDGVATLEPVTATVHGGKIDFNTIFNARYNRATLSTQGGVQSLDVAQATTAMDAGVSARGVADLDWALTGAGSSSAELTKSLHGPINFDTTDIALEGIAMEQMICSGVALVNQEALSAEFPADTQFQGLSAKIQFDEGVATLNPLTAKLNAISLTGNGKVDLNSQELRASVRAQLSAELGEMDPACVINERYTDLRWPVECEGSLSGEPADWCKVNTTEIVKDIAEGEIKRKAQKEVGKLFKKLFE
ncbi:MAG: AsmA family protein [Congregibacter sp.]